MTLDTRQDPQGAETSSQAAERDALARVLDPTAWEPALTERETLGNEVRRDYANTLAHRVLAAGYRRVEADDETVERVAEAIADQMGADFVERGGYNVERLARTAVAALLGGE